MWDDLDLDRVAEFAGGFDRDREKVLHLDANRDVYDLPGEVAVEAGLEGNWLLKYFDPVGETGVERQQNMIETQVYLESGERGQDFVAPVLAGGTDYSWILVEKLHQIDFQPQQGRPGVSSFRQHSPHGYYEQVVPQEWTNLDPETEFGFDGNAVKVLDTGRFELNGEWSHGDPLDYDGVEVYGTGEEYFAIPRALD